jgi:hypothetical protein
MWRFVAIVILAMIGMIWFMGFADFVQRCALIPAFGTAVALPPLMNPTRRWARGFFLCVDIVYAAACLGAWWGSMVHHVPRIEVFTAGLVPALLFGTMASLGVGRSGLAELEKW